MLAAPSGGARTVFMPDMCDRVLTVCKLEAPTPDQRKRSDCPPSRTVFQTLGNLPILNAIIAAGLCNVNSRIVRGDREQRHSSRKTSSLYDERTRQPRLRAPPSARFQQRYNSTSRWFYYITLTYRAQSPLSRTASAPLRSNIIIPFKTFHFAIVILSTMRYDTYNKQRRMKICQQYMSGILTPNIRPAA